jgi:type IV secretion system protein VirB6
MDVCAPLPAGAGFLQWMLAFLDCQAQLLGSGAYQFLSSPGSTLALVLTGFLTLFVALFGYRMLLGQGPDLRTGVLAFVKIGIVLALATSWPAWRTLVYDVVIQGPAQIAGEIGRPIGLPGADGGLVARLDGADQAFTALAVLGEGTPPVPTEANQVSPTLGVPPQPYPGFNTYAIAGSRMLFLIGAIGGLGAVRLVIGLLLAVGPFFVAFLLFDNTRSLFEGWIRVLAGAALGAVATSIALGVELALLEPWLADLLARRSAQEWLPGMPIEILVATTLFTLTILAMLYGAAKIAFAFRFAPLWNAATVRVAGSQRGEEGRLAAAAAAAAAQQAPAAETRTRAATVVDAVAATQRREAAQVAVVSNRQSSDAGGEMPGARRASPAGTVREVTQTLAPAPLGQSFRRRTRGRVSASAGRRDRRS